MKEQMSLPCYAVPYLNRILFYTDNRVDRDFYIWDQYTQVGRTQGEIADMIGCCQSVVNHTCLVLRALGSFSDVMEYFSIQFELADILSAHGLDIDKYVTNITNSLMRHRIRSREQIIAMTPQEVDAFCNSHTMKRAGFEAIDIFKEYYFQLCSKKIENFLNEYAEDIKFICERRRNEKNKI